MYPTEWFIFDELDDLKDEVDNIFRQYTSDVCDAYADLKFELVKERLGKETENRRKCVKNAADVFPNVSHEYYTLLVCVLFEVYNGHTEGFDESLLVHNHPGARTLIAAMMIKNEGWPFLQLLSCYEDQLCQKYR